MLHLCDDAALAEASDTSPLSRSVANHLSKGVLMITYAS